MIKLIKEQKATMIVEHISYNQIEGEYDSTIFTAEKSTQTFDKAFRANKAIQDYVFTDGSAEKSIERRFVEDLDAAQEVCVYAKLPKGFHIPTPGPKGSTLSSLAISSSVWYFSPFSFFSSMSTARSAAFLRPSAKTSFRIPLPK